MDPSPTPQASSSSTAAFHSPMTRKPPPPPQQQPKAFVDLCQSSEDEGSPASSSSVKLVGGSANDAGKGRATQWEVSEESSVSSPDGKAAHDESGEAKAITLSPEQKAVLRAAMEGRNFFFTGRAGTGKSFVLREIIKKAPPASTFITASTGIAAVGIGGQTVHAFAGIGLGTDPIHILREKAANGRKSKENWRNVKVLMIDEVSMLPGSLLDTLDDIAKHCKGSNLPFGGIQVIVTGDFFQLPPVQKSGSSTGGRDYCFTAKCWPQLFRPEDHFELQTVFRTAEPKLVGMLEEIRYGRPGAATLQLLQSLSRPLEVPEGLEPTKLFSTNRRVDEVNFSRLSSLPGEERVFRAEDDGKEPFISQLRKNCLADDTLRLRVGAQVMLLRNIDQASGLVNGSTGRVEEWEQEDQSFYPVVHFSNGVRRAIRHEDFTIEVPQGGKTVCVASRHQLPLKLAWAITIHKSQGMGLEWLEVDISDIFEEGQGYVALSRAIKLNGLRVLKFDPRKFRVHPAVVDFYEKAIKSRSPEEHGEEKDWNIHPIWVASQDVAGAPPSRFPADPYAPKVSQQWFSKPNKRPVNNAYGHWYAKPNDKPKYPRR